MDNDDERQVETTHFRRAAMEPYKNLAGDSGVTAYQLTREGIVVQFQDGWKYEYTKQSAGAAAITTMRRLATNGTGLSSFVSANVRKAYLRKFR
jgi:hypothetical protein